VSRGDVGDDTYNLLASGETEYDDALFVAAKQPEIQQYHTSI